MNKKYPKVLIVGNTFDEFSGAGVTLTNLFKNWPKEKIAVAATSDVNYNYCERERPCSAYYSFAGGINKSQKDANYKRKKKNQSFIRKVVVDLSAKVGHKDWDNSFPVDKRFLDFYDEFNPDVIYSSMGNIALMRFMIKLRSQRKFRLVIHIWDEFLGRYNYRWFPSLWKRIGDHYFLKAINMDDVVCLAIGDKMADDYGRRYGKIFYPFHNPVDPMLWDSVELKQPTIPTVAYFGKVNKNTITALQEMAEAVEQINKDGIAVRFLVHSGMNDSSLNELFAHFKYSELADLLPREDIPAAFKSSSVLFFPISFDEKSIKYQKLSIQTKLTEYLISRVPIFMYSSPEIAAYQYLSENDAAITCEHGVPAIIEKLKILLQNPSCGDKVSNNAYELALRKHTTNYVREKFLDTILNAKS